MKVIPLTQGKFAIVDNEDYYFLMQWKWTFDGSYAIRRQHLRTVKGKSVGKKIYMHRLLMETPAGLDTDHINRDRLDNRRRNLRVVSHAVNLQNSRRAKKSVPYRKIKK